MYKTPKLIFGKMGRVCEAVFDSEGEYASMNTNCLYEPIAAQDLAFLAAYCNSKLFMFLYNQFFRALRMAGGYYQFQAPQLRVMPVPSLSVRDKAEIGSFATRLNDCQDESERAKLLAKMNKCILDKCQLSKEERERILES
jgi:hypothetical protein